MESKYLESSKRKSYTQTGMYKVHTRGIVSEICSRYSVNVGMERRPHTYKEHYEAIKLTIMPKMAMTDEKKSER